MSEHGQKTPSSEGPRPHSPVSVISRFSFEEHRDSNNGDSSHPGPDSKTSRRSSISASSQVSTEHIALARPLSAAVISSNDRFTSTVTPDLAREDVLDATEQVSSVKPPTVAIETCNQDGKESDERQGFSMWNPVWLWRTTLAGFMVVLILLIIALIVLYHFSNLHHGLSTQFPKHHYGWTYGPTAGGLMFDIG